MIRSMCRRFAAAVALGTLCTAAQAQPGPIISVNPFKVCQPWAPKWAAQRSSVVDCQGTPFPGVPIAFDDWICTKSGPIQRVTWWGTVCNPVPGIPPPNRFYIAVWTNDPMPSTCCRPQTKICGGCVEVQGVVVGIDCLGNRVYRYTAKLPCQFTQVAGTHYWLQISEVMITGAAGPVPRWCWSEHRNIKNCNAVQGTIPAGGGAPVIDCILQDPCDNIESDLAFCLYSRSIIGHVTPAGTLQPQVYNLWLLDPQTGDVVEKQCIKPTWRDGFFDVFVEAPDGLYDVWVGGMATPGALYPTPIMLEDGTETDLGVWMLVHGNADADLDVDFGDVLRVLSSFGVMGPTPPPEE